MKYDTNMNAKESYLQENESFLEKRSDFLGRVAELFIKSDVYKWQSCTDSYNTTKDGYTTGDIPEDFMSLRKQIMQMHDDYMENCEKIGSVSNCHNGNGRSDHGALESVENMEYKLSDQSIATFSYLCLFLCRLPKLGITFAPEINHRKVEPSQFYEKRDGVCMFNALSSADDAGFDSKRVVVYPFTIEAADKGLVMQNTVLRSVMQTNLQDNKRSISSTIFQVGGVVATKSTLDDFNRLRFLLNVHSDGPPNDSKAWVNIFRSNKLSTPAYIQNLFKSCELPDSLKVMSKDGRVDVFLTLRQLNMFFTLYGCTRLAFVEGQHRMELTSRAAFGYRVDRQNIGVPLREDDTRDQKYNSMSSMYKGVAISVICDKCTFNGDELIRKINVKALKAISQRIQTISTTYIATPLFNVFRLIFSDLSTRLHDYSFVSEFLGTDIKTAQTILDIEARMYRDINSQLGTYSYNVVSYVEQTIVRLLVQESPFKDFIKVGSLKTHENRLISAFAKSKGSPGAWMWTSSKKGDCEPRPKGPFPIFHRSLVDFKASGKNSIFKMKLEPYDVEHFRMHMAQKYVNVLIHSMTSGAEYTTPGTTITCLTSMVVDVTQFGICVPFVRESILKLGAAISNVSTHPINDPMWFAMYVLLPCRSIADILLYHITKSLRVLGTDRSKKYGRPSIQLVNDSTTLSELQLTSSNKRKRDVLFNSSSYSNDMNIPTENGAQRTKSSMIGEIHEHAHHLKENHELSRVLFNILETNMDAKICDPASSLTLDALSKYSKPKGKLMTIIYARAIEMYFDLLRMFAEGNTRTSNDSLVRLRDGIVELQKQQNTDNVHIECTRLFLRANDTAKDQSIDFSCIEAIMIMYPSVLWLNMMSQTEEYIRSQLLQGYNLKSQHATLMAADVKDIAKDVVANSFPSWSALVGPAKELTEGIAYYVTKDCTPSTKQLLPRYIPSMHDRPSSLRNEDIDNESTIPKLSLEDITKLMTDDIWMYHACLPSGTEGYTVRRRALTEHLIAIIRADTASYVVQRNKKSDIQMFCFLWRMIAYFQCIFSTIGSFPKERFESLVACDSTIEKTLLSKDESGVCLYHMECWRTINKAIVDHVPDAMRKKIVTWNRSNPKKTIDVDTIAADLDAFYIDKSTDWPSENLLIVVEAMVNSRHPDYTVGIGTWNN